MNQPLNHELILDTAAVKSNGGRPVYSVHDNEGRARLLGSVKLDADDRWWYRLADEGEWSETGQHVVVHAVRMMLSHG